MLNFDLYMVSVKHQPFYILPQALDYYLANGWFRMSQNMFITHFLHVESQFFPAVWLRYRLENDLNILVSKKLKSINRRFQIKIGSWKYSAEQEALYAIYRSKSGMNISASLFELLMGNREENIFNTYQVEIYEGSSLIALGIFDMGEKSAAGISNIYHPEFRKYSLGKALLNAKIHYCFVNGLHWFYPGYAVPGRSRFNYKLDIAPHHTEYFCPVKNQWLLYVHQSPLPNSLYDMERRLSLLQEFLSARGRHTTLVYYRFFDAGLRELILKNLLQYPMFLLLQLDPIIGVWLLVVYDLVTCSYSLLVCSTIFSSGNYSIHEKWVCTDILQVADVRARAFEVQELYDLLNTE